MSLSDNQILGTSRSIRLTCQYVQAETKSANIYSQTAYHGTSHDFKKFSLTAIGTGEGFQTYGWGLYFAGERRVAEYYRDVLSARAAFSLTDFMENLIVDDERLLNQFNIDADEELIDHIAEGDFSSAEIHAERKLERWEQLANDDTYPFKDFACDRVQSWQALIPKIREGRVSTHFHKNLYQVKIPDDEVLLDWDKPLYAQTEFVVRTLLNVSNLVAGRDGDKVIDASLWFEAAGRTIYQSIKDWFVNEDAAWTVLGKTPLDVRNVDQAASEYLNSIGIPGLRYLDGVSRDSGKGSYNYVIWDDNIVTVTAINNRLKQADNSSMGQKADRAAIEFGTERFAELYLTPDADASSLVHEGAHLFLEMYTDAATLPGAQTTLTAEYQVMLDWFGLNDTQWRNMTLAERKPYHEKFAETFELYLATRQSPVAATHGDFEVWMKTVYQDLRSAFPSANLSPDIVALFDRMIAPPVDTDMEGGLVTSAIRDVIYQSSVGNGNPEAIALAHASVFASAYARLHNLSGLRAEEFLNRYSVGVQNISTEALQKKFSEVTEEDSKMKALLSQFAGSRAITAERFDAVAKVLDMGEEARKKRAQKMGYNTDLVFYHGSDNKFDCFEVGVKTKRYTTFSEWEVEPQGIFLSSSKRDAKNYGKNVNAYYVKITKILENPLSIRISSKSSKEEKAAAKELWEDIEYILEPEIYGEGGCKFIDIDGGISRIDVDDEGEWISTAFADGRMEWSYLDNPEVVNRLKQRGYDAVWVYEPNDESGESLFVVSSNQVRSIHAAFDPQEESSALLLAQSAIHNTPHGFKTPSSRETSTGKQARLKNTPSNRKQEIQIRNDHEFKPTIFNRIGGDDLSALLEKWKPQGDGKPKSEIAEPEVRRMRP